MNKYFLTALATIVAIWVNSALADPTVFGLEVGETTEVEFHDVYRAKYIGVNESNGGNIYHIFPEEIDFDGIHEAEVVFDLNGILHQVHLKFNNGNFSYLKEILDEQYEEEDNYLPSYIRYRDGNTTIELSAAVAHIKMQLMYLHDEMRKKNEIHREAVKQQKLEDDKSKF